MQSRTSRYPGAQPFGDDDLSRRIFFGREDAVGILVNQIAATRLVVMYAKSGLGKTSLLNAGVSQRLRDDGMLPLVVRVNDTRLGPLRSVFEGIRSCVKRHQVEYVEGDLGSLWGYFKTVEFWRDDLMLTPVLIIDQFEELFTLQGSEASGTFFTELGYLIRGLRPPSCGIPDGSITEVAPVVHVVLSLREDYLGYLEEGADRIPQILDHRFRLTPLTRDAAFRAMSGPAQIKDTAFYTASFSFDPAASAAILEFLSRRVGVTGAGAGRYIDPFQLQLILRRVEEICSGRAKAGDADVVFNLVDIGGVEGLKATIRNFYREVLRSIPHRRIRRRVRTLCEEVLIGINGRRLSIEEGQIAQSTRVSKDTLAILVEQRLIRKENRSDAIYYELSHDALLEAVSLYKVYLGLALGIAQLAPIVIYLILVSVVMVANFLAKTDETLSAGADPKVSGAVEALVGMLSVLFGFAFLYGIWRLTRSGIRSITRFRRRLA